ncbi:MAG TPA: cation diffusion facilitator family transporter [Nitrososphaeraceae archaeon]|jgi:cobalt-zinc-cadmium efflux system protein|nr:cation diffusion facilitator family transporter [Nitrososphaeraceae archaeon]
MQKGNQQHSSGHRMPAATSAKNIRALKITAVLTGTYFIIELAIGIYSGSIAVLSDSFHTFSAVGGVLLALAVGHIATRPANVSRTFGLKRAEVIGALLNGFFLLIMAIMVLYMGYMRLEHPMHVPPGAMLIAAFGGLVTEVISIKLLYSGQKGNLNLKGAFWHVLQTFVGSLIIIIAAIIIYFTGFLAIDPLLGMAFGIVLIYASIGIVKDSLKILLETVPKSVDLEQVMNSLQTIPGVKDIHHMHAWTITSGVNIFSTHIKTDDVSKTQDILKESTTILKEKFDFYFSTIQIEQECLEIEEPRDIDITKKRKQSS